MITYGTNPGMGIPITGRVPDPDQVAIPASAAALQKALAYMDSAPGPAAARPPDRRGVHRQLHQQPDQRPARGRAHPQGPQGEGGRARPGGARQQQVKRQAEREGLHEIFIAAGAEWREAGCSMCIAMNGDQLEPGQYAISTSNRNFEGRQGKGGRTFLASPLTAAASAVTGVITDARTLLDG
jgi:3-isopropylmalate/(R)-2-methylmalate dehydratase large subunit